MHYYRLSASPGDRLVARQDSTWYDLTSAQARLDSFVELVRTATIAGVSPDELARRHIDEAAVVEEPTGAPGRPVDPSEVWAAGVTYEISEEAREAESQMPAIYRDVYDADRPELFFKATASRTVGPGEPIGIREDSDWDVPEPELGVVLYEGEIVGYTVGNDVSSRSLEGQNPLYLPQAKIYERCCSLGPCVATPAVVEDPEDLDLSMTITRDGTEMYSERTSTAQLVRSCEELVSYYTRHNTPPELSVLLTGTSLVPEEGFTLQAGDTIDIELERVGTLTNTVDRV
jgi:2-dehydro-3-deoxy-D-arabinonate dehydratase